jgi:hypothetical protein
MSIVSSVVKHLVKSTFGSEMPCRRAAQIAAPDLLKEEKNGLKEKKYGFFSHTNCC